MEEIGEMPRFYFDVHDGASDFIDTNGIVLQNENDIRYEARNLLRLLSYEQASFDEPTMIVLNVKSETGDVVYQETAELRRSRRQVTGSVTG